LVCLLPDECKRLAGPAVGWFAKLCRFIFGAPAMFRLERDFVANTSVGRIVVEAGYVTDLASIPWWARWWLNPDSPWISSPSIIHDKRYSLRIDREADDRLLRELMLICGARPTMAWVVWLSVRIGGRGHWVAPRKEAV
jgi:hypothetical protein